MKKLLATTLFALTTVCFTLSATAQKAPQKVKSSFTEKYPEATHVEWDYNDDPEDQGYEADFILEGQRHEVLFAEDGTWKQTEKQLSRGTPLPEGIKQTLKSDYPNVIAEEVYELTNSEGTFYKVELDMETESEKDEIDYLLFTEEGSLSKEVKDADDEGWFFN